MEKIKVEGVEYELPLGRDVQEAIRKFGDDVVFDLFCAKAATQAKRLLGGLAKKEGLKDGELEAAAEGFKPEKRSPKMSTGQKRLMNAWVKMSAEEREKAVELLKGVK